MSQIGSLKIDTSLLGFGCMRLPETNGKIDMPAAEKMLDRAYRSGVNYFDTAYVYHNGKSEGAMGAILKKYPRKSYYIADKMPVWQARSKQDLERIFNEQLDRLGVDYIDFYLMHSLDRPHWENVRKLDMLRFAEKKRAEGKIRFIGFSFHDDTETFREIVNAYDWDFCQIQLNYADWKSQHADELYHLVEQKNLPLIVMEPIRGGDLASPAEAVRQIFLQADPSRSAASWALRFVGSLPQVKVILSGMSTLEQVEDNLATFDAFEPFTAAEFGVIDRVNEAMAAIPQVGCTGCRYCMPCPAGVEISKNFRAYNDYQKYQNKRSFGWTWQHIGGSAAECVECGACLEKCPQHIDIPGQLKKVAGLAKSL